MMDFDHLDEKEELFSSIRSPTDPKPESEINLVLDEKTMLTPSIEMKSVSQVVPPYPTMTTTTTQQTRNEPVVLPFAGQPIKLEICVKNMISKPKPKLRINTKAKAKAKTEDLAAQVVDNAHFNKDEKPVSGEVNTPKQRD
ncbi:hypothetical protein IAR55_004383 [Kwoniella newhampshirensis]|uniref:Uncharacterized protein n=1 Tax=Kwoniella newhampshirensis TaxID=1651941 RepID=A0AAW0YX35_9TREE